MNVNLKRNWPKKYNFSLPPPKKKNPTNQIHYEKHHTNPVCWTCRGCSCRLHGYVLHNSKPNVTKADFGETPDGTPVAIYTLQNSKGAEARIMTYGGIVQKLTMPDKNGKFADIVNGFDTLNGYTDPKYTGACPYFGALIGRYGNRIGGAKFSLDGKTYTLATITTVQLTARRREGL